MSVRLRVLKWLIPSKWVEWLNGRKRILGLISLALWAIIYVVPAVCTTSVCSILATVGVQVHAFLVSLGIDLDSTLLDVGTGLTVIGLIDWIVDHWFSKVLSGFLKRWIEQPLAQLALLGDKD